MRKQPFSLRTIVTLALLLLITSYTSWLLYETNRQTIVAPVDNVHPDFIIKNVTVIETSATGKIKNHFQSAHVVHYNNQDTYFFDNPHLISYSEDGKAPWDITALHGKSLLGFSTLILWDDVKLHEISSAQNADTLITTTKLTVYPKLNYAHSDEPVTLIQPDLEVHSIGMNVYFKEKRVQLLKQAQGIYDETNHSQKNNP